LDKIETTLGEIHQQESVTTQQGWHPTRPSYHVRATLETTQFIKIKKSIRSRGDQTKTWGG